MIKKSLREAPPRDGRLARQSSFVGTCKTEKGEQIGKKKKVKVKCKS